MKSFKIDPRIILLSKENPRFEKKEVIITDGKIRASVLQKMGIDFEMVHKNGVAMLTPKKKCPECDSDNLQKRDGSTVCFKCGNKF